MKEQVRGLSVLKYAGAFVAFEIGSGFATGQEILQFYTAYGFWSLGAMAISTILFAWVASLMMKAGYAYRKRAETRPYNVMCGKYLGPIYEWFVTVYLLAVMAVMLSGAGATINEYYGVDHYIGSLGMAVLVFAAFAMGLSKLIDIVGLMGPAIIGFSIFVAIRAIIPEIGSFHASEVDISVLSDMKVSSYWWVSGILYVSYNVVSSVAFLMAIGKGSRSMKEARMGGIVGGVLLMITVVFMNFALMLNLDEIEGSVVPTLRMAKEISPVVGAIFVIVMICGIFSTAAPMLWTVCSKLADQGSKASLVIAFLVCADALILGQLPFDQLVGAVYPLTGYLGIIMMIVMAYRFGYRTSNRL